MGTPEAWADLAEKLGRAHVQISKTDEKIAERHSKFSHIPHNLPRIGLIVTMEPYPFIDAGMIRRKIGASPAVPTRGCSSNVLEWRVRLKDRSLGEYLVNFMNDPSKEGWELDSDLPGIEVGPNAVFEQVWSSYQWSPRPQTGAWEDSA